MIDSIFSFLNNKMQLSMLILFFIVLSILRLLSKDKVAMGELVIPGPSYRYKFFWKMLLPILFSILPLVIVISEYIDHGNISELESGIVLGLILPILSAIVQFFDTKELGNFYDFGVVGVNHILYEQIHDYTLDIKGEELRVHYYNKKNKKAFDEIKIRKDALDDVNHFLRRVKPNVGRVRIPLDEGVRVVEYGSVEESNGSH